MISKVRPMTHEWEESVSNLAMSVTIENIYITSTLLFGLFGQPGH